MDRLRGTPHSSRLGVAALAVVLGIAAWAAAPAPAAAQFWYGLGPRYYAPFPYYHPPPAYYPYYPYYPPAPAYYPQPEAAYGAPPADAPGAPAALGAPAAGAPGEAQLGAAITYTERPAFRNAAGQTCREYRANGALGTACQDSSGQWRVAN